MAYVRVSRTVAETDVVSMALDWIEEEREREERRAERGSGREERR